MRRTEIRLLSAGCRDHLTAGDVEEALKGVGWGLKIIGRFYPDPLIPWLRAQRATGNPRRLTVRKAITYLPLEIRGDSL